jgi:hypothetical protein
VRSFRQYEPSQAFLLIGQCRYWQRHSRYHLSRVHRFFFTVFLIMLCAWRQDGSCVAGSVEPVTNLTSSGNEDRSSFDEPINSSGLSVRQYILIPYPV